MLKKKKKCCKKVQPRKESVQIQRPHVFKSTTFGKRERESFAGRGRGREWAGQGRAGAVQGRAGKGGEGL